MIGQFFSLARLIAFDFDDNEQYIIAFGHQRLDVYYLETNSIVAKKILGNFEDELKKFKQICPIEMLDKLDNPITLKSNIKKVS